MSGVVPDRIIEFEADTDFNDLFQQIRHATPAQIKSYVQSNVTDLTSAKILMAKILLIIGRTI